MEKKHIATKKNYPKRTVVILQSDTKKNIYFLNQGVIEVKRTNENTVGYEEKEIIAKSRRIDKLDKPIIFGVDNLLDNSSHVCSYVCETDCVITEYSIIDDQILNFFKTNPPILLNVLVTLQEQIIKNINNYKKVYGFLGNIEKVSDNLQLLSGLLNPNNKSNVLYNTFISNNGTYPNNVDYKFLTEDFSSFLNKSYNLNESDFNKQYDIPKLNFLKRLIKSKPPSFVSLALTDINIFTYIFNFLSNSLKNIYINTEKLITKIENKLNYFFLDVNSPFNTIVKNSNKIKNNSNIGKNMPLGIVKLCKNIENVFSKLGGRAYPEVQKLYNELISISTAKKEKQPVVQKDELKDGKYKKQFKNSLKHILAFSTLPNDQKKSIQKNIQDLAKFDLEKTDPKKAKAFIQKLQDEFFTLYLDIFMKSIQKPTELSEVIKLFLYFAFIDERLISENHLEAMVENLNLLTESQMLDYPIVTLYDFLLSIYNEEEEPSISEMGETFKKALTKFYSKNEKKLEDTPLGKVGFEIDNMVSTCMRITSENRRAYIPYLTQHYLKGSFENLFVSPVKLNELLKKLNAIDYTLFFRETSWREIPGKSLLIKKEVKPYFILIPNVGVRIQMWQDMVNNKRTSRGRLIVPVLFIGDLYKAVIQGCAHYRWELNKSIVSNWMDPVDGGLTGAYYDYSQYYHKDTELSSETKEKIKQQFRSIKFDRDRFAHDYSLWVEYEKDGTPKVNKLVRRIFYKFIPFPKVIRDNIGKLPGYMESERKFKNIRNRDYRKYENQFRKYADANGDLPEDLQAYLDMLKS